MLRRETLQEQSVVSTQRTEEQNFWLNQLAGEWTKAVFPPDHHDREPGTRYMERITFRFSGGLFDALMKLRNGSDPRMFMIIAAGLVVLLNKYTGSDDIVLGAPVLKQDVDAEFINTSLVLRNSFRPGESFKELLLQVRQGVLEATKNQNYPVETLPRQLNMAAPGNDDFPLFAVAVLVENIHDKAYIEHLPLDTIFSFSRTDRCIEGTVEYNSTLYKKKTMERIAAHYTHLLKAVLGDVNLQVSAIDILPEEEKRLLLVDFNDTRRDHGADTLIHRLFEDQVEKTPGRAVVVFKEEQLTYRWLNRRSNQLARHLQARGVQPGTIVGIISRNSPGMIAGIFGILKAGGAYLPLDPYSPGKRVKFILDDSGVDVVLGDGGENQEDIADAGSVVLNLSDNGIYTGNDTNLEHLAISNQPAYVIYTSGTTGRPKGVLVEHGGAANTLLCRKAEYKTEVAGHGVSLQLFSHTFDGFVTSFFTPVISGSRVVLLSNEDMMDIDRIREALVKNRVTCFISVPSLFQTILEELSAEDLVSLQIVTLAGEKLLPMTLELAKQKHRTLEIAHEYGVTEAAVMSTLTRHQEKKQPVTIGKPIWNTRLYIVGKGTQLLPVGVPGELCIAGAGLARGYLNNPELTAEKYVDYRSYRSYRSYKSYKSYSLNFSKRLYKTGDLARWLEDGNIEFLGRIDHQVKIRGFRIEPGEIESRLLEHRDIVQAVVIPIEAPGEINENTGNNGQEGLYLCTYFVARAGLPVGELREFLLMRLPNYMLPTYFVSLDKIPLTPNGKVDRKALPEPEIRGTGEDLVTPRNKVEKELAGIWADVLGVKKEYVDHIGIDLNFFDQGGYSIKATQVINKIHQKFDIRMPLVEMFKSPTIRGMAQYINTAATDRFISLKPIEKKAYHPPSSAQKRLFVLQRLDLEGVSYNAPIIVEMVGIVDKGKLERAFRTLIHRHESLRTSFHLVDEQIVQVIHEAGGVTFEVEYYNGGGPDKEGRLPRPPETDNPVTDNIIRNFIRIFDLTQAPLMRAAVIHRGDNRNILVVDMHHIISDAASLGILIKEFIMLYKGEKLPEIKLQYRDYSEWQNRDQVKEIFERQEAFWLKQFEDYTSVLNLPADYPRPAVQSFEGNVERFGIGSEETLALNRMTAHEGVTLYTVLLALFNVFLSKLSSQEDIVVGTPVVGRRHADLEHIIGMFVNTLALRNYPGGEKTFREFLQEVKENTLAAFDNQEYHFEDLVEKAGVERDISRNPLFDVMFSFQNIDSTEVEETHLDLEFRPYGYKSRVSKFDMTLSAMERGERLFFSFQYCTKLFKKETIERFAVYFREIVSNVIQYPDKRTAEISIIPQEEEKRLLYDFNNTTREYPREKTLAVLFAEQVEKTPDRIALVGRGKITAETGRSEVRLTYRELSRKSDQLACLLKERGIRPDNIVGIMLERSLEMIIAVLGTVKAGGAYLPIDPVYPRERVKYMLADSNAGILVSESGELSKVGQGIEVVTPGEVSVEFPTPPTRLTHPTHPTHSTHLCYVIYTSGSTGRPKGVMIEHRSLVNFIKGFAGILDIGGRDSILSLTTICFDIFGLEVFLPLTGGSRVVMGTEEEQLDARAAARVMAKEDVTILQVTPSRLSILAANPGSARGLERLKYLLVGGEALPESLLKKAREIRGGKIYNLYGPTETTIWSAVKEVSRGESLNIGKPIANTRIYMLGKNRTPQPIGVPGELVISGAGLARGYTNRPGLTAERFLHLTATTGRIYRTGDLARWLPDGNIEFLDRMDHQVKIRGNRIELGEIETHLMNHDEIKEAVVVVKEDEDHNRYLCAYIVSDKEFTVSGLRDYLSGSLPAYMLPAYFIPLEKIPLSTSGKVDRKRLPEPGGAALGGDSRYSAPRDVIEKKLVEIWQDVLGRERVGIDDNFFEIGGDSIRAIQMVTRMKKAGYNLEMKDIFGSSRIAGLARLVKKIERIPDQSVITGTVPLTPVQKWLFENRPATYRHFNQAVMFFFQEGFGREAVEAVFLKIREYHDALRMTYKKESGQMIQVNGGLDCPFSLDVYDYRGREEAAEAVEARANEIQAGMNPESGSLMKLALFHLDDGDRLLVVLHHLVIDGVSWRILFEDIAALYNRYNSGEALEMPPKTDSFKVWAEELARYADSGVFLKEKTYWKQLPAKEIPLIKKDFDRDDNFVRDSRRLSFLLSEEETGALLTKVNEAFGTEINDILLTALGMAVKKATNHDRLAIMLEGHGREEIPGDIDISRTVGWFTGIYPVVLDFSHISGGSGEGELSRQIREVKETLRRVPNKGIGYGILRYLTAAEHKTDMDFSLHPQFSFNYLGQFDADIRQGSFRIAPESAGRSIDPASQRDYEFDISGMISNNRLRMTVTYNNTHYKPETVQSLCDYFEEELRTVIAFCRTRRIRQLSPHDLTYKRLSIDALDAIAAGIGGYAVIDDIYTLSPMQEGMLFHALVEAGEAGTAGAAYFEQLSYRLQGELDISSVEKSISELFKRHDVLRTLFVYEHIDPPLQVVLKERAVDFCYKDIRDIPAPRDREAFIRDFKNEDKARSFNLSKDTLMRVAVIRTGDREYQVDWSFHHILMDGWCIGIILAEFFEIYRSYLAGRPYRLPDLIPYRTYIRWLETRDKEESGKYWQEYLAFYDGLAGVPGLVSPGIEEEDRRYKNERIRCELSEEQTGGLRRLAGKCNVTLNTAVLTLWGILLGKYNRKQDVVFGEVVSGRPLEIEGVESMVGLFINTVPVRISWEDRTTFRALVDRVQKDLIDNEPHHYYPLAEIQSKTTLKQNLLDHIFAFENFPLPTQLDGLARKEEETDEPLKFHISGTEVFEQTNYDFNVICTPGDRLSIRLEYNGKVYDAVFVRNISNHIIHMLRQILRNDRVPVRRLDLLPEEEKKHILYDFNDTAAGYPGDRTIHELFETQVEMTPDRAAVTGAEPGVGVPLNGNQLTYRELNEKSHRLAHHLRSRGVGPDTIVGIMSERSVEMITGILGILKAGGAYLPIDVDYPGERIDYMLKDSNVKILVSEVNELSKVCEGIEVIGLSEVSGQLAAHHTPHTPHTPHTHPAHPAQLCYVIYTSGTTGKPKGSLIEHKNVVRLMVNDRCLFDFTGDDVWTMFHSYCFDFSVWEMYGALLYGGLLVVVSRMTARDPQKYLGLLKKHGVTVLNQTPSAFYNLAAEELGAPGAELRLRYVIFGGEALKPLKLKEWARKYPRTRLVNMFGITETTVHVTYKEIGRREIDLNISNIGKPIPTLVTYVMDNRLKLLPIGATGELCVGGDGVCRGYLNRPQLAAEKFVADPHAPGKRLYRSGDLGKWLGNGDMVYRGRMDHQVKIRGFRVETAEIESWLSAHEEIKEAVVTAGETTAGDKYLCAYYIAAGKLSAVDLREYLAGRLPGYMIPAYFIPLKELPLTPNGKIDMKALPDPEAKAEGSYAAPRNDIERKLAEVWQAVLGVKNIGIEDNFFELGGDSIKVIQAAARLRAGQLKLEIRDLFSYPTIKELSKYIRPLDREIHQGPVEGDVGLVPIQKWFFENNFTHSHHYNHSVILFRQEGFNEKFVEEVFSEIVKHHDALRVVYRKDAFSVAQWNRGIHSKLFDLEIITLADGEDIEQNILKESGRIQRAIDLQEGPLVKLGLFKTGEGDHLLIVIHHLVVDGVSWRILLEDFSTGYRQVMEREEIQFPPKTDSFQHWASRLMEYSESKVLLKELEYWKSLEESGGEVLPRDHDAEKEVKKRKNGKGAQMVLTEAETTQLLKEVNRAYNTEINDILLTALGMAVNRWAGVEKVTINLEGHGREPIIEELDISRTVGWFTSQYPVVLDMAAPGDLSYKIKFIKETLRRIPNKGVGYGILRYLTPPEKKKEIAFALAPEISFNYLGQFEQLEGEGESRKDGRVFEISRMKGGDNISRELEQLYAVNINGMLWQGQLVLNFSYNRYEYDETGIEELVKCYRSSLLRIIDHCVNKKERELTPSDMGCGNISLENFIKITGFIKSIDNRLEIAGIYPLTPMQDGMLYHSLESEGADPYFQQSIFSIDGVIDRSLIQQGMNRIIDRYDILRTVFVFKELYEPLQVVLKRREMQVHYEDISGCSPGEKEKYLEAFIRKDKELGFDLARDLLTRLSLIKTGSDSYKLVWSSHHILMDGWCMGIIFREFMQVYRSLKQGRTIRLNEVTPYIRFIRWLEKQDREEGLQYWKDYLEGYGKQAILPGANRMETGGKYSLENYRLVIGEETTGRMNEIARENQVTLNTLFQALWGLLLQQYNYSDDVVYGVIVSGRPYEIEGIETMVGLFINTVPLRVKREKNQTFSSMLKTLQQQSLSCKSYEYLPLAEIQTNSLLNRGLIDHIMVFENYPVHKEIEDYSKSESEPLDFTVGNVELYIDTNYNFSIVILPGKRIVVKFSYNRCVYESGLIRKIASQLEEIIRQVVEDPFLDLNLIGKVPAGRKKEILLQMDGRLKNEAERMSNTFNVFQHKLNESLELFKNRTAVEYGNRLISYGELDKRSNYIANYLLEKGIKKGATVGILVEDRYRITAVIIGILKAGCVFVPLDTSHPEDRLKVMIRGTDVRWVIVDDVNFNRFAGIRFVEFIPLEDLFLRENPSWLDAGPAVGYSPEDKIYIYFTSGSTGTPRAILGKNSGLLHFIQWEIHAFGVDETVKVSQLITPGFDAFLRDIFVPLCAGGSICIPGNRDIPREPVKLMRWLEQSAVNLIHCGPALFRTLDTGALTPGSFKALKYISLSGEKVGAHDLADWFDRLGDRIKFVNLYGPTETTLVKTYHVIEREDLQKPRIPVGRPMRGAEVMILDNNMNLCDQLVTGEIYIRTPYMTYGYYNNPGLTAERFLPDPFNHAGGNMIYRTGDIGRILPDGTLDLLGRNDRQVKLRGIRIELEEIEGVLAAHPLVKEAAVIKKELENRNEMLCAFASGKEKPAPADQSFIDTVKEYLEGKLPPNMVPADIVSIGELPRKPNGKIDYGALAAVETGDSGYIAPVDEIEIKLAKLWAGILGGEKIGTDENFFTRGGNSLNVMSLITKIHKEFDVRIRLGDIFSHPTIKGQSQLIKVEVKDKYLSIEPAEKKEYYALSSAQMRLYILQEMEKNSTAYNMPQAVILEGALRGELLEEIFKKIIKRHESLRTCFTAVEGVPVQRVSAKADVFIEHHDLTGSDDGPGDAKALFQESFIRPFDLSRAPLMRIGLIRVEGARHILMADVHHIISDAVSQELLIKDFSALYEGKELEPLRIQYRDYTRWQKSSAGKEREKQQEDYWLDIFKGEIPVLNMPLDYPRPEIQAFEGRTLRFHLEKEEAKSLKKLAAEENVTSFMLLLTIYNILLSRITGQEDIIVGTVIEGRSHEDLRPIIGMFVNTLALRNYPGGEKTFTQLLREVKEVTLGAFENGDYQFEALVEKVVANRDIRRNPLFDVLFEFLEFKVPGEEGGKLSGLGVKPFGYEKRAALFDMNFRGTLVEDNIFFNVEYNTGLYKKETIEKFIAYFKIIVSSVLEDPGKTLSAVEIIRKEDKKELIKKVRDEKGKSFINKNIEINRDRPEESEAEFEF